MYYISTWTHWVDRVNVTQSTAVPTIVGALITLLNLPMNFHIDPGLLLKEGQCQLELYKPLTNHRNTHELTRWKPEKLWATPRNHFGLGPGLGRSQATLNINAACVAARIHTCIYNESYQTCPQSSYLQRKKQGRERGGDRETSMYTCVYICIHIFFIIGLWGAYICV